MALYIKIKENIPENVKLAVDFGSSKFNVFAIDLVSNISLSLCDKFKDVVQVIESFLDLPGDQCRLMLIDSSPSAAGLQEKYFLIRLGASVQLKNRIRTRITQAMGRCTRDEGDYSVVIIYGNDITQWLCNDDNTQEMHPELQAEISFGLDNSNEMSTQDFVEIAAAFLSRSNDWQNAEGDIRTRRDKSLKVPNPINELLANSMKFEIDYTYNSWKSRHEDAFQDAIKVLSCLEGGRSRNSTL